MAAASRREGYRVSTAATRLRVLLVEDEAADRTAIVRALRDYADAYEVSEVETGRAGLARCLGDAPPDCVLLDFRLPDMTAPEFLAALRLPDTGAVRLPVAVITGHNDRRAAVASLEAGAEDYLAKDSVNADTLPRVIENVIEKHRIRRELEEQRAAVEQRNRRLEAMRDELQARVSELAEATRAKDRFLAVMSHEMRTPLNAILGYSDLLTMQVEGSLSESQQGYIQRIRVGSRHLLDLINNVLDLTRADVRKLELDIRPVDVIPVIEEVAGLLESEAQAAGLALDVRLPADRPPLVEADLQRLRQVLINLVGNAIKFTDAGSVTIEVDAPDGGAGVGIRVTDTGIGIEEETLPLIFDEFYQAKGELTRRHGGSGLGLAISQQLAEMMGGRIAVRSTVGEGSVFTLELPRAAAGRESRAADTEAHRVRAAEDRPKPATVTGVVALGADKAALQALGERVAPAVELTWTTDPEALVALVRSTKPGLVVLDISTAGRAGWDAVLRLQADDVVSEIPVLLLPSIPSLHPDDQAEGLDLGWVSLVPKPFTTQQLAGAVRRASTRTGAATTPAPARNVLIVDDDPDSRRVAFKFLDGEGVQVREAADGETALAMMREDPPDIAVLDLMMPVLDGFGVLAAMRSDPRLTSVPVVVLTAKTLTEAEREFLSRTADQVLQKGQHRLADVAALVLRAAGEPADS
jgi:signal transduction histidine kinase